MTEQTRLLTIDRARARDEDRTAPATLSTEYPVNRGGFFEVLSHAPDAIDLSRSPLPLIEAHDNSRLNIGLVENLRVHGGKLKGDIRLGNSSRASEVWADIKSGVVRNLSVGYHWIDHVEDGDTVTVTRWMPFETSLVAAAADPNAGIYRSFFEDNRMEEPNKQTRSQKAAQHSAVEAERERVDAIMRSADAMDMRDMGIEYVQRGATLAEFQTALLDEIGQRNTAARSGSTLADPGELLHDSHFARELNQYSLSRLILSFKGDQNALRAAGREYEISQELAHRLGKKTRGVLVPFEVLGPARQRAVTYAGTGANLVGTEHLGGSFIDLLRARSALLRQQITQLTGLVGNVDIPKITGGATGYWIAGDGDPITESTPTFGKVTMSPKTLGGLVEITHRTLMQSDPAIEQIVRDDLAATLSTALDYAAINADGTNNAPVGVLNTAGVALDTYANGGAPDLVDIVGMEASLALASADMGALAYLANPGIAAGLKTTDVGTDTGQFIWTAGRERGEGIMNGFPAFASANVSPGTVIFGNWRDFIFATWGALELMVDPYGANFSKGSIAVRAMMDVDFAVRHGESFAVLEEATL
ncbi:MAG: phage major capsid protein [Gammaproteobacteria bacterium]|nr:phage major capsid protein [Gammaproteobacteria bacterium]